MAYPRRGELCVTIFYFNMYQVSGLRGFLLCCEHLSGLYSLQSLMESIPDLPSLVDPVASLLSGVFAQQCV